MSALLLSPTVVRVETVYSVVFLLPELRCRVVDCDHCSLLLFVQVQVSAWSSSANNSSSGQEIDVLSDPQRRKIVVMIDDDDWSDIISPTFDFKFPAYSPVQPVMILQTIVKVRSQSALLLTFKFQNVMSLDKRQLVIKCMMQAPLYHQNDYVRFRCLYLYQDSTPYLEVAEVHIEDPNSNTVFELEDLHTDGGAVNVLYELPEFPPFGRYTVRCGALDQETTGYFQVIEYYSTEVEFFLKLPKVIPIDEGQLFDLNGVAFARYHSSGHAVEGHLTIQALVLNESLDKKTIIIETRAIRGSFRFTHALVGRSVEYAVELSGYFLDPWINVSYPTTTVVTVTPRQYTVAFVDGGLRFLRFRKNSLSKVFLSLCHGWSSVDGWKGVTLVQNHVNTMHNRTSTIQVIDLSETTECQTSVMLPVVAACSYKVRLMRYDTQLAVAEQTTKLLIDQRRRNHFVQASIDVADRPLRVNNWFTVTIQSDLPIKHLVYLVVSRSEVLFVERLRVDEDMSAYETIMATSDMVPVSHLLVMAWNYMDQLDSYSLHFTVLRNNHLSAMMTRSKDMTGWTGDLLFSGHVHSLFLVTARDHLQTHAFGSVMDEFHSLKPSGFESMATHAFCLDQPIHCESRFGTGWTSEPRSGTGWISDLGATVRSVGLGIMMSGAPSELHECPRADELLCISGTSCFSLLERCDGVADCDDGSDEIGCFGYSPVMERPLNQESFYPIVHRLFNFYEDLSWFSARSTGKVLRLNPSSQRHFAYHRFNFARKVSSVELAVISTSHDISVSIASQPLQFQNTRTFFAVVHGPKRVVFGEQIGVQVDMFNFQLDSVEAHIVVKRSPDYRVVRVESNGVVGSSNPTLLTGDHQILLFLEAGTSRRIHVPVKPMRLGSIDVTIEATVPAAFDRNVWRVLVESEGVSNNYYTGHMFNLLDRSVETAELHVPIEDSFQSPYVAHSLFVPGSLQVEIRINEDYVWSMLVGGARDLVNQEDLTLDSVVLSLASAIHKLMYMSQNDLDNGVAMEQEDETVGVTNLMLITLYGYLVKTGDDRCFFVRYKRNQHDDQQQNMDTRLTAEIMMLLRSLNDPKFEMLDLNLQSSLIDCLAHSLVTDLIKLNQISEAYQLALSMIALSTAGYNHRFSTQLDAVCSRLHHSLENMPDNNANNLTLTASAHALAMCPLGVGRRLTGKWHDLLQFDQQRLWSRSNKHWNTKNVRLSHTYRGKTSYQTVASHAHLIMYKILTGTGYWEILEPVRWLHSEKTSAVGWVGQEDTFWAQRALLMFAGIVPAHDHDPKFELELMIGENSVGTLTRQQPVAIIGSDLLQESRTIVMIGRGRPGSVFAHTSVNVEYPWLLQAANFSTRSFYLDVVVDTDSFRNFSTVNYQVCVRRPGNAALGHPVVVEVQTPTGYFTSFSSLFGNSKIKDARKEDRDNGQYMVFILEEVGLNETCWGFQARRAVPVANMSRYYTIVAYDLTDPGIWNKSMYQMDQLHGLDVCQVCGSYQCPYCPQYAIARRRVPSSIANSCLALIVTYFALAATRHSHNRQS